MESTINQTNSRNFTLDIVKGVLIFLMVIGHSGAPEWLHDFIYVFHMPCFFIISGMLFKERYLDNIGLLIYKRFKSLWRPFVLWTVIFVLLHNFFYKIHFYDIPYSARDILINLKEAFLFRKTEDLLGGFWFLRTLFFATFISVFWLKIMGTGKNKRVFGIVLFLALSLIFKHINFHNFMSSYVNYLSFLAAAYFMTGKLLPDIRSYSRKWCSLIVAVSIVVVVTASLWLPVELRQIVPYYLVSSCVSVGVIVIFTKSPTHLFIAKKLMYLGSRTLDILIFHFLAMKAISFFKILHLQFKIDRLSEFPVINECNAYYWVFYVVAGIFGSILISDFLTIILKKLNLFFWGGESVDYKSITLNIQQFSGLNLDGFGNLII